MSTQSRLEELRAVLDGELSDEMLAQALDLIFKLSHDIGSSPEDLEDLRLQLDEEKRTYASRIIYANK